MFIEVTVVLVGVKVSIFLFDKEKGTGLERIERMDFARFEIFVKEVFSGFLLIRGEGVDFPNLRNEGFVKVYFVVIRLRWRCMVSGFFGEDRGELNSAYSGGRVTLGLAFSATMASSVAVVSLAIREEPEGIN